MPQVEVRQGAVRPVWQIATFAGLMTDASRKTTTKLRSSQPLPRSDRPTVREIRVAEENRCRGLCLLPVIARARALDFEAFMDAVAALDADVARLIEANSIQPREWYPIAAFRTVHGGLRAISGGLTEARFVGLQSSQNDLTTGLFRTLTKVVSPGFLMERAAMFFRFYVQHGQLSIKELRDNEIEVHFRDCRGFDAAIFQDLTGGVEGSLTASGGTHIELEHLAGGADGDTHLSVRLRWR